MTARILTLTLAIVLTDISDDERTKLAVDLEIPVTALPLLERTSPARVAGAVAQFINKYDIDMFATAEVYAEISDVTVVSAAYDLTPTGLSDSLPKGWVDTRPV
jgi:hypothetical protein